MMATTIGDHPCHKRISALQLARLQESSRRMSTGLRGVEPEENRGPEHRLIPQKNDPQYFFR